MLKTSKLKNIRLKEQHCYILSPIIVAAVLLTAFFVGDVFPFGKNTVMYFDMAQRFLPNLYHTYDALHSSDTALWFNWMSGLGVNDVADASFSLFWIPLMVLPRRLIGKAMSLYVVMFFAISSISACAFLRVAEKTKPFVTTMLAVCYSFCGYSVMYYTNMWQDTVALFPLLMLSFVALIKKGRALPYIILVFLNFQCNYYVFGLSLIYLFFAGFLYISLTVEKDKRKKSAQMLGVSTLFGILLSAFSLAPKLAQTLASERFVEETGFDFSSIIRQYLDIAGTAQCKYPEKPTMLFLTALPIAITVTGLIKSRNFKKVNAFHILDISLMLVPLVFEGTNLLLHLGDYKYFPMRTGYILSFALIWSAGHFSKYIKLETPYRNTEKKKTVLLCIANSLSLLIFCGLSYAVLKLADSRLSFEYSVVWALPVLVIAYALILAASGRFLDYRVAAGGLLSEIFVLAMLFIPYSDTQFNQREQSPAYIETSQKLSRKLDLGSSATQRIKTIGTTLNCNYGTVIGRATISDFTHLIPVTTQSSLISLGYSGEYTRLHDSGGTAFTDALLGVTNVLSVKNESDALYNKLDKKSGYNYYECKYTLPYGITVDKSVSEITTDNKGWMELNNELYTCLSGDSEQIVTNAGLTLTEDEGDTEYYTFTSQKNTVSYFRLRGAHSVNVYVNGKKLTIPSVDREDNKKYPGRFNRNLICLGELGDGERVEIKLVFKDGKFEEKDDFRQNDLPSDHDSNQRFSVEVGLLDLEKLSSVCEKYKNENNNITAKNYTLTANVNADENKVLLLPLQFNECWSARVNSSDKQVFGVMGLFSAVELGSGESNVVMHFSPTGFRSGLIISIISLIAMVILLTVRKRLDKISDLFSKAVYCLYSVMFVFGTVVIYISPVAITVIRLFG